MSSIAAKNNTTVAALMAANSGNASVKSQNLIVAGGSMNLPAPAPVVAPTPVVPTPTGSGTTPVVPPVVTPTSQTAVPPSTMPTDGMAASFGSSMADIDSAENSINALFPLDASGSPDTSAITAEGDANDAYIKAQKAQSEDIINSNKAAGDLNRNKALDLLRLGPSGSKQDIDSFIEQSDAFDKGISDDIASLDDQENSALANNDANTAAQIRQTKLDYFNLKLGAAQTKASTLTSFYSALLSGKTEQLQEESFVQSQASNILNQLLPTYAGMDPAKIPDDVMQQLQLSAAQLGIPTDSLNQILANSQVSKVISKGNYIYGISAAGKIITQTYAPSGTGSDPNTEFQSYISGDVTKPSAANSGAIQAQVQAIEGDAMTGSIWNARNLIQGGIKTSKAGMITVPGDKTDEPATPQGYANARSAITDSVVANLASNPVVVAQYLGLNYSPYSLTADQIAQLKTIVGQKVGLLIPDSFFSNAIKQSTVPYQMNDLSGSGDSSGVDMGDLPSNTGL